MKCAASLRARKDKRDDFIQPCCYLFTAFAKWQYWDWETAAQRDGHKIWKVWKILWGCISPMITAGKYYLYVWIQASKSSTYDCKCSCPCRVWTVGLWIWLLRPGKPIFFMYLFVWTVFALHECLLPVKHGLSPHRNLRTETQSQSKRAAWYSLGVPMYVCHSVGTGHDDRVVGLYRRTGSRKSHHYCTNTLSTHNHGTGYKAATTTKWSFLH